MRAATGAQTFGVFGVLAIGTLSAGLGACGDGGTQKTAGAVTFWQDVAPVYNSKCVRCHQQGGIAPFRLDTYADAKAFASIEKVRVNAGTMPPYFLVHDGSCGSFQDDTTLSDQQKATINAWVDGGTPEGTQVMLTLPPQPALAGASDVATPRFMPIAQGGQLAEFDEYRCFLMDWPHAGSDFLTGYDVTPGDATIVHHVLGFVVDLQQPGEGGRSNADIIQSLQDPTSGRAGWPCFGGAGDGVNISGLPITWAPGQGVVTYPDGMGVPVSASDKLVVQLHYNLADARSVGRMDSTTVHLRFASSVQRQLAFLLPDPFLDSIGRKNSAGDPDPDTLPPGQADAKYTWSLPARQVGVDGTDIPWVDLVAVMPHMHGRGVRQMLKIGPAASPTCAAHLENWNFHWQEFYFYKSPLRVMPDSQIQVTCEYDTSNDSMPVLPGWGTRNEMCLAVMMVALPPQ
jgi:Copper type II ascorbate-dependent monooxygenase, C-terminal domain